MLFNTPIFFVFFVVFFLLYSFVFLKRYPRLLLIVVGSFIFYAGWNYRFIPLLVFSAVVDYFLAIAIHNANDKRHRQWLLGISIATNLGVLATFKYADFAIQSAMELMALVGIDANSPLLDIVLPVGISFYTFQSMSYTIDVYRSHMQPHKGLLQFTAALSFFPQLVAGPILRAREILPQLEKIPVPQWSEVKHGLLLVSVGLLKKTIADLLGLQVDSIFASEEPVSTLQAWTAAIAFAGQIYGDFSGYTDMAIGLALILGFKIPINFRLPYFASSPIDFWRRWHISLSSWLRDYLYISLGGNRNHRYRNIMITMLLGGLWHGAAWTYVIWGFFHGLIIALSHWLGQFPVFKPFVYQPKLLVRIVKWALTFYLVLLGWVIFRADSISGAWELLTVMHLGSSVAGGAISIGLILSIMAVLFMHGCDALVIRRGQAIEKRAWLLWPLLFLLQLLSFFVGAPSDAFIYFQF